MLRVKTDSPLSCRQVWPIEFRHGVHTVCFDIGLRLDQHPKHRGYRGVLFTFWIFSRRLRITGASRCCSANSRSEFAWCTFGNAICTCCHRRSHRKSYCWGDSKPWMEKLAVILWYHNILVIPLYDGGKDIQSWVQAGGQNLSANADSIIRCVARVSGGFIGSDGRKTITFLHFLIWCCGEVRYYR